MAVTRRGRLGGTAHLTGTAQYPNGQSGWVELCRQVPNDVGNPVTRAGGDIDSATHTIFSAYKIVAEPEEGAAATPRVLLRIQVGDGNDTGDGSTIQIALAGKPVTVSGSTIIVSAQLFGDELGTVLLEATEKAVVEAFITEDGEGENVQQTGWVIPDPPLAFAGWPAQGAQTLRAVQGFNAGASPSSGGGTTYLMFFDWGVDNALPPDGTAPLFSFPVPGQAYFSNDFIESARTVAKGLAWVCSSTPDTLTNDNTQLMRVDCEFYLPQQVTGTY